MEKKGLKPADMAYIALFAVLMAVCAWITIPSAVPFTMQTFGVCCALCMLGGRRGTLAVLVYLLLGAVGLPVFSGFQGGAGVLLGATGGYLLGFLLMGLIFWLLTRLLGQRAWVTIAGLLLGLLACYAFGTVWFMRVYARTTGEIGLAAALGWCVVPFIVPDICKISLAIGLARLIRRRVKLPEEN